MSAGDKASSKVCKAGLRTVRFVVGDDRSQSTLFPEPLEDYLSEDNPAINVFVDELARSIRNSELPSSLWGIVTKVKHKTRITVAQSRHAAAGRQ
jgi:hypothetical protein